MKSVTKIDGLAVSLPNADVDTDQIIPARFLKVTDKKGLGEKLFHDWRFTESGEDNADFILNKAAAKGASVLVAGHNFGCGSSREHAPWALLDFGFRAIISTGFADIFQGNALKNGLVPIVLKEEVVEKIHRNAPLGVKIDVVLQTVSFADETHSFDIDKFAKKCIVEGKSELDYLLDCASAIRNYEERRGLR